MADKRFTTSQVKSLCKKYPILKEMCDNNRKLFELSLEYADYYLAHRADAYTTVAFSTGVAIRDKKDDVSMKAHKLEFGFTKLPPIEITMYNPVTENTPREYLEFLDKQNNVINEMERVVCEIRKNPEHWTANVRTNTRFSISKGKEKEGL